MALRPCKECGQQVSSDANSCPQCGKRQGASRRSRYLIVLVLFLFITLLINWMAKEDRQSTSLVSTPAGSVADNDAELLIARCGQPSSDISSEHENPRPLIPSRIIEYRKQRLRFTFVPGGNTRPSDSPPNQWKLVGITEMTAANPSHARVVSPSEAVRRMPCWAGK